MEDIVCGWDNDNLVIDGTPWEVHHLRGAPVHVKREDLCCPPPGPSFSKIRGVAAFLSPQPANTPIGVLDTSHSKAGWGVSYVCNALGMLCHVFYPVYKAEGTVENHTLREYQANARNLGAEVIPLRAGRSAVLYHQSRRLLAERTNGMGVMMPNALKLPETVRATAKEVRRYTPPRWFAGTWVVSISSGTIAAGVMQGLQEYNDNLTIVAHMGYSRSISAARRYMIDMAGYEPRSLVIVDEGYAYKDKVAKECPFPCNEYYDLKAWKWLAHHIDELTRPIIFWDIGD